MNKKIILAICLFLVIAVFWHFLSLSENSRSKELEKLGIRDMQPTNTKGSKYPPKNQDTDGGQIGLFKLGNNDGEDPYLKLGIPADIVRVSISWGEFQPAEPSVARDGFDWENKQAKLIRDIAAKGGRIIPSIRTIADDSGTGKENWALHATSEGLRDDSGQPIGIECRSNNALVSKYKASALPKDLKTTPDPDYGYSKSYYTFVKKVLEKYRNDEINFEIVVIENEMNSRVFWCGSPDQYLRLLDTAIKAAHDVDPAIKVSDGGIQGFVLDRLSGDNSQDDLSDAELDEAAGGALNDDLNEAEALPKENEKKKDRLTIGQTAVENAQVLIKNGLYDRVDLVNFHHYQSSENIGRIAGFLRARAGGKPMFSNEVGSREGTMAAGEMVKKFTKFLFHDIRPVIWFSPSGEPKKSHPQGSNDGALINSEGDPIQENVNAFKSSVKYLNNPILEKKDLSIGDTTRISFQLAKSIVDVVWSKANDSASVASGCQTYNHQGFDISQQIYHSEISLGANPIFIVCDLGSPAR